MIHSEAGQVDHYDHAGDKELLVFVAQYFRHHETYPLDVLKLLVSNLSVVVY